MRGALASLLRAAAASAAAAPHCLDSPSVRCCRPLAELERVSFHTLSRRLTRGGGRGAGPSSLEATGVDARPLRQRRRRGDAADAAARRSGGLDLLDEDDSGYGVDLAQAWGVPSAALPAKRRQGAPGGGAAADGDEGANAGGAYDDGEADFYEPAEPKPRAKRKRRKARPRRKKRRSKLRGASGSGSSGGQAGAMENFLRSTGKRFDETLEEEELRDEVFVQLARSLNIGFGEAKALRGEAFDTWLARASNPLACFLLRIGCVSLARLCGRAAHLARAHAPCPPPPHACTRLPGAQRQTTRVRRRRVDGRQQHSEHGDCGAAHADHEDDRAAPRSLQVRAQLRCERSLAQLATRSLRGRAALGYLARLLLRARLRAVFTRPAHPSRAETFSHDHPSLEVPSY